MQHKLLAAITILLIAQTAIAATNTRPLVCPSVETLKNIAISNIGFDGPKTGEMYGVELSNTYGTGVEWTFIIGGFEGKYRSDILAKANAAISSLTLQSGPTQTGRRDGNEWACDYVSNDGSARIATAITPTFPFDTAGLAKLVNK